MMGHRRFTSLSKIQQKLAILVNNFDRFCDLCKTDPQFFGQKLKSVVFSNKKNSQAMGARDLKVWLSNTHVFVFLT